MAKLKIPQHVKLHKLVVEEYATSGMDDVKFATYASEKLGFIVTRSHVGETRRHYAIKSNYDVKADEKKNTIAARVAALEQQVADLTTRMNKWEDL